MPTWKPAYLIRGDDHGRVAERRGSLRRKAEAEAGAGGVEVFEGDRSSPEDIANALAAMTFAMGHRFLIVDGTERWSDADVKKHLVAAIEAMAPDTTVAFFAREDGRAEAPAALIAAVEKAGGVIGVEQAVKPRDLPRWAIAEARKLGLELDAAAAHSLVGHVGERQQRLLRELEKLAIEHGAGARIGVEEVDAVAAPSAERQVWGLVDALIARDHDGALRAYLELRAQGESLPRLIPLMARRVRDVLAVAARLEAGETPADVKGSLKMSPWAADKRIKEARSADSEVLRRAVIALADLELASRGLADIDEDTAALRAIELIAV